MVTVAYVRRRARKRGAVASTEAGVAARHPSGVDDTGDTAPIEGVAAGKILEVDLSDGAILRVEYSHFPESTVVRWRITHGAHTERGEFASGGGSARHVETVALRSPLEAVTEPTEVSFEWTVGGVAFNYAVHRNLALARPTTVPRMRTVGSADSQLLPSRSSGNPKLALGQSLRTGAFWCGWETLQVTGYLAFDSAERNAGGWM